MSRIYSTWSRALETNLMETLRACQIFGCPYPGVTGRVTFRLALIYSASGPLNLKGEPTASFNRMTLQQNARESEMLTDRDYDEKCF
jgi:hypothetical protein